MWKTESEHPKLVYVKAEILSRKVSVPSSDNILIISNAVKIPANISPFVVCNVESSTSGKCPRAHKSLKRRMIPNG